MVEGVQAELPPTLSIGNVVTVALALYRQHLWAYLRLALIAHLWLLVPIYGWARFGALAAAIAHAAVAELMGTEHNLVDSQDHCLGRMWPLWGASILVFLIMVGLLLPISLFVVALGGLVRIISDNAPLWLVAGLVALLVLVGLGLLLGYVWVAFRLTVVGMPMVVEPGVGPLRGIERSIQLTGGSVLRLQGIVSVGFLVMLPFQVPVQAAVNVIQILLFAISTLSGALLSLLLPPFRLLLVPMTVVSFVLPALFSGALFLPFWQTMMATLYYDLRCRREGWTLAWPAGRGGEP